MDIVAAVDCGTSNFGRATAGAVVVHRSAHWCTYLDRRCDWKRSRWIRHVALAALAATMWVTMVTAVRWQCVVRLHAAWGPAMGRDAALAVRSRRYYADSMAALTSSACFGWAMAAH